MVTAENIKAQLAHLVTQRRGVDINLLYLYSPAFNHVHNFFADDEVMSGYCIGALTRNGKQERGGKSLGICTNHKLILLHSGLVNGLTHVKIPLADITAVTSTLRWWSNKIKIKDTVAEWEFYQINKTDLHFFELALNEAIAAQKK